MDSTADRQRPILIASFAFVLKAERSLVADANALDKRERFCVGGGYPEVFESVTAINRIAIREADVSDGDLP